MKIYQIELTNYCNFNCNYCPRKNMTRPVGFMSKETLNQILNKIENNIIRLHHYGESFFHPKLLEFIKIIKKRKPKTEIVINTNGSKLNEEYLNELFNNGLDLLNISYHNEQSINKLKTFKNINKNKIKILKIGNNNKNLEILKKLGFNVVYKRLRDLGQLKKEKILKGNPINRCSFLKNNEVVILWNGDIVPCCECYDNNVLLGNIKNNVLVKNKEFDMCKTCLGYGNDNKETEQNIEGL